MPEQTDNLTVNPLRAAAGEAGEGQGQQAQEQSGQTQEQPQQEPQQLILGKFKSVDDLAKSYQQAERKLHSTTEQLARTQDYLRYLENQQQAMVQKLQELEQATRQPTPQQPPQQEEPEPTEDDFLENPLEATKRLLRREIARITREIEATKQEVSEAKSTLTFQQQKEMFANELAALRARVGEDEYGRVAPVMARLLDENPYIADMPNAVQILYDAARGRVLVPQAPSDPLSDPAIRERILADENIRKEILARYGQEVKNNPAPPVLGNQPGGSPPAAPPEEIKSLRDATRAFLARSRAGG